MVLRIASRLDRSFSLVLILSVVTQGTALAVVLPKYYGHPAVHDKYGVIAPWFGGLNGQCDYRVRVAAETMKRYPWTTTTNAITTYPHYIFNGFWGISSNGVITPKSPGIWGSWANGDLGQRAFTTLNGWVDYYRYTGDPAAIAHATYMADYVVDHNLTPPDNPWPGLFISVPTKGVAYGNADPAGIIQLDICAATGRGLLRAYQLTGNHRWFEAAKHWGDLLSAKCHPEPGASPWPRYANPEDVRWRKMETATGPRWRILTRTNPADTRWTKVEDFNKQTGGVIMILGFLDELIRLGHTGEGNAIVRARDAGRKFLSETLLPAWTADETWGRIYWDWPNAVQGCLTADAASYLLDHPESFPNWRQDARNILTLFFNRSGVSPKSDGDTYSGAWAYPESCGCCQRSLWYAPLILAPALAQWGVQADSAWGRELAYRQMVLQTYDADESGVSQDNIDGGVIVNGEWFNIAHPLPLRDVLSAMAWLPEELGASRENHVVRSSAVVNSVRYGDGLIEYSTFDAPPGTVDVLRLSFAPKTVTGDGRALPKRGPLRENGYTLKRLPNGDAIVSLRHDGCKNIRITGDDPQQALSNEALDFTGEWSTEPASPGSPKTLRVSEHPGAALEARFAGNQVRLIGRTDVTGGLADVYLDGEKQRVPVDSWNPAPRQGQVLYYRNGLPQGPHTLRIVARGEHSPFSLGNRVAVEGVQFSAANQAWHFPAGSGPTETQRLLFGYPSREDYRDSHGHGWRPGTEFVIRLGDYRDSVTGSWWTQPPTNPILGTRDPELYRYGIHGPEFWVNLTVGPGEYDVRLAFANTRGLDTRWNCFDILINGRKVVERLDVTATAGGPDRAVDLLFRDIAPRNGVVEVRFKSRPFSGSDATEHGEAFVQALEVGRNLSGKGAVPVSSPPGPSGNPAKSL